MWSVGWMVQPCASLYLIVSHKQGVRKAIALPPVVLREAAQHEPKDQHPSSKTETVRTRVAEARDRQKQGQKEG